MLPSGHSAKLPNTTFTGLLPDTFNDLVLLMNKSTELMTSRYLLMKDSVKFMSQFQNFLIFRYNGYHFLKKEKIV